MRTSRLMFIYKLFIGRLQVSHQSYGLSIGVVHVKTIAVFITGVQYLGGSLFSNIRPGKRQ